MKKKRLNKKLGSNSGIILFIVLWMLVILSMLAVSIGRGTHIDLALAKHSIGKVKSKYYAWGGLIAAMNQMQRDTNDDDSKQSDILYFCGIPIDEELGPYDHFANKKIGSDGRFDVGYGSPQSEVFDSLDEDAQFKSYQINYDDDAVYGLVDEERKININALTTQNVDIMVSLIVLLGFDEQTAEVISYSILDWRDRDDVVSHQTWGAEDDYYEGLSPAYKAKNFSFESLAELMLVRGMTEDIYKALKPYVTIFPKDDSFRINFDTASLNVLKALTQAFSGGLTNTDVADAESLVEKIVNFRAGDDGIEGTNDDQIIELNDLQLNAKERTLFLVINQFRTRISNYFRVHVRGTEEILGVSTYIEAVVERSELAIVQWHRY